MRDVAMRDVVTSDVVTSDAVGRPNTMRAFKKGDRVTWKSPGGQAEGEVIRKITRDTEAAGRTVRASPEEPQYLVRSFKSGGEAVHHPSALSPAP